VGATKEVTLDLHAVADDPAFAVLANRGHRLDRALEAVENMTYTGCVTSKALSYSLPQTSQMGMCKPPWDRFNSIYQTAYRACRCSFVPPGQEMEIRKALSSSAST